MRASVVFSAAAVLTAAAIAPMGPALARGGSHGSFAHRSGPAPAVRSSLAKPSSAYRSRIVEMIGPPGKTGVGISKEHSGKDYSHYRRHRRVFGVGAPYDSYSTCVQILPSGRRVYVTCSPDVIW
jgi:hypothetical protein